MSRTAAWWPRLPVAALAAGTIQAARRQL